MAEIAGFVPRTSAMGPRQAPTDLEVRLATVEDAPAIAIISAAREGLVAHEIEPRVRGELAAGTFGTSHATWVATTGGRIVCYARLRRDEGGRDDEPQAAPSGWYLMGVVVSPAARRQGVGAALLEARLAWAAERTDHVLTMTSEANRASRALLESHGFRVIVEDVHHPRVTFQSGRGLLLLWDRSQPSH